MIKEIEIHYFGNLEVSQDELVGAFNKALPSDEQITRIETLEIIDYGSRFGHLLPERGGDSDFGFRETIELILAFGTVQAFLVFAKAFLSKSGEMLAEKLFKLLSKPEREAALTEEKDKRKNWRSVVDETVKISREYGEWSEDRKKEEYEYWRLWGEAVGAISYNARYSLDIYVEEKDATQHVSLNLTTKTCKLQKHTCLFKHQKTGSGKLSL